MSVVKRERQGKKRKRPRSPTPNDSHSLPVPAGGELPHVGAVSSAGQVVSQTASAYEQVVARYGLDPQAAVSFVFRAGAPAEKKVKVGLADLLSGASQGWLLGAAPEAAGEEIQVPQETPLTEAGQTAAFQILIEALVPPARSIKEAFCGQLRLLPHAFLAAHMVGLESSVNEIRSFCLRCPELVLRTLKLRKGDGQAMLRALDLGLGRTTSPTRPGVAEQLKAAEDVLLLGEGAVAVTRLGKLLESSPVRLLHLFRAAKQLHAKESVRLLQLAATRHLALSDAVQSLAGSPSPVELEALRTAVRGGLDQDAPEKIVHLSAGLGSLELLQVAVSSGQAVNTLSLLDGQSPCMLAAAAGHIHVVRWLARAQANLGLRCRSSGLTARDYAARHNHRAVLRLLDDPLSQLAV